MKKEWRMGERRVKELKKAKRRGKSTFDGLRRFWLRKWETGWRKWETGWRKMKKKQGERDEEKKMMA